MTTLHRNLTGTELHEPKPHTHTESEITDLDHTDAAAVHLTVADEIHIGTPAAPSLSGNDLFLVELSGSSWQKAAAEISDVVPIVTAVTDLLYPAIADLDDYLPLSGGYLAGHVVLDPGVRIDAEDNGVGAVENLISRDGSDVTQVGHADYETNINGDVSCCKQYGDLTVGSAGHLPKIVLAARPTAGATLFNGSLSFYLDESGNFLKVEVKYSNGTTKTGTIAALT